MFRQIGFFSLPITLVVLLLWLPFGFSLTGLVEEWGVLYSYIEGGKAFFVTNPFVLWHLAAHYMRPLTVFPHALAYISDPNSFTVWHLFTIISIAVKGISCAYLGWILTRSRVWSLFLGILVVLYPADTMQLSFRVLHVNASEALFLAATAIHFATYEIASAFKRYLLCFLSCILLTTAFLMYEVSIAMFPIIFFVMYLKEEGWHKSWQQFRQRPAALLAWCEALVLYLFYLAIMVSLHPPTMTYQQAVADDRGLHFFLRAHLPKLFTVGVFRGLIGGWYDALRIACSEFKYYTYLIVVLLSGLIYWLVFHRSFRVHESRHSSSTKMAIVGVILLMLAYMPFLASYSHMFISQRTFLFATLGAALVVLALLRSIAQWHRWVAICCSVFLLMIAFAAQLQQFNYYVTISNTQKKILKGIMENFDGNLEGKELLVLDGSNLLGYTWYFNENLYSVLSYLYNKPIGVQRVHVCLQPENVSVLSEHKRGQCVEYKDKWVMTGPFIPPINKSVAEVNRSDVAVIPNFSTLPKNKLVIIKINPDLSVEPNPQLDAYRARLQTGQDSVAKRYRNIVAKNSWPLAFNQFISAESLPYYRLNIGKWWSLDIPLQGVGWGESDWSMDYFNHRFMVWKKRDQATLLFKFSPKPSAYVMHGQFETIFGGEAIKKTLHLRLNKHELPITWLNRSRFTATIPPGVLVSNMNKLEFISRTAHEVDPNPMNFSFQLSGLELIPAVKNNP